MVIHFQNPVVVHPERNVMTYLRLGEPPDSPVTKVNMNPRCIYIKGGTTNFEVVRPLRSDEFCACAEITDVILLLQY